MNFCHCPGGLLLDMRCNHVRDRAATFHRVRDCMFSELSLVALADAYRGDAPLCVLTTGHPTVSNGYFDVLSTHAAQLPALLSDGEPGPPTLLPNRSGAQWVLKRARTTNSSSRRPAKITLTLINTFSTSGWVKGQVGKQPAHLDVSVCRGRLGVNDVQPQTLIFPNEMAGFVPGTSKRSRLLALQ